MCEFRGREKDLYIRPLVSKAVIEFNSERCMQHFSLRQSEQKRRISEEGITKYLRQQAVYHKEANGQLSSQSTATPLRLSSGSELL